MTADRIAHDRLGRTLFEMTWPMLFGTLALMSYQLVDAAWISLLGVEPLAALGFTVPIQQFFIGFQVGIGIATTAVLSRTLGSGDAERARQQAGVVVLCGMVLVSLLAATLWFSRTGVFSLLGAESDLFRLLSDFWSVWLLAAWAGAMAYFGYSIHRAHGDTRFPGLMMLAASLLNLVLDPVFIFVLDFGLRGAAMATLVSFSVAIALTYPRLLRQQWLHWRSQWAQRFADFRRISQTAGPAMVSQLMPPLSASIATSLVAGFGSAAVAGWGLGTRLEFFSLVVVLALTMSMPPLVGRLCGAGDLATVRRLVNLAVRFVLIWQAGVALLWVALSGWLVPLVAQSDDVATVLTSYLYRVPLSYPALGVCMIMVSVSNALGLPVRALIISLARLFLCYLPCLWLGSALGGFTGLLTGAMLGNLAAGLTAWQLYRRGLDQAQAVAERAG